MAHGSALMASCFEQKFDIVLFGIDVPWKLLAHSIQNPKIIGVKVGDRSKDLPLVGLATLLEGAGYLFNQNSKQNSFNYFMVV